MATAPGTSPPERPRSPPVSPYQTNEPHSWKPRLVSRQAHSGTNNNCIEHAVLVSGRHAVRDTKDRALGHTFGPEQWRAFVAAVQDGSPQGS
ncbi:DUF397 domain-containing protein [Streptomyces sp. NPDC006856]|uniref:DUF397 domain-containing protein n=1 Tax=Streptomyces sp. NPDC006856 TaxID=3364766 RepID=UPI0036C833D3